MPMTAPPGDSTATQPPARSPSCSPSTSLAVATCAGCGSSAPLAAHLLYGDAPALVVRCPSCTSVVLRHAAGGGRLRLDLTGASLIIVTLADTSPAEAVQRA
jgi:Family of unknown function (DUF6510)